MRSMGLLEGTRLMAWTTKSPIQENHWVPVGCRALLGSVNPSQMRFISLRSNSFPFITFMHQVNGA